MYRNFCFTLNNYSDNEFENLLGGEFSYVIIGKEVGEEGTPHLQGYCELVDRKRLTTLKKINDRIHWEPRRGTQEQAVNYCKKDGNWVERGELKRQGARNDLDNIRNVAHNDGMRAVVEIANYQQICVAEKYLTYNEEPRNWKPDVTWIWGPTGTGKSKTARELCGDDVYTKSSGNKWWCGYDGHEYVIIDDFRDSWWPITEMLRLLDRYECKVEVKGGMRQFKPRKIVITSCMSPRSCYINTGEAIDQLIRRVDRIGKSVTEVTEVEEVILNALLP